MPLKSLGAKPTNYIIADPSAKVDINVQICNLILLKSGTDVFFFFNGNINVFERTCFYLLNVPSVF